VKLLFDANLSPKLVKQLHHLFPHSVHLFDLPLPRHAPDTVIWDYAKQHGFDIVTADGDDYPPLVERYGPPPRVILLESWRYPTRFAHDLMRENALRIAEFGKSEQGLLILRR
jgi:predicted nuclease of predicted toxin-antitoxin system